MHAGHTRFDFLSGVWHVGGPVPCQQAISVTCDRALNIAHIKEVAALSALKWLG